MGRTQQGANKKVAKNGAVFGFAITSLVFLVIEVLMMLVATIDGIIESATFMGLFGLIIELAGLITYSIFIAKYKKYGYEMKGMIGYGIVFIIFGCLSWGYFIFSIVTGILVLVFRKRRN